MKETELAAIVVDWLQRKAATEHQPSWLVGGPWAVAQEVPAPGGGVVDIVLEGNLNGQRILHAVECKISMGLAVLDQALRRKPYFHYTSVAVLQGYGKAMPDWDICTKRGNNSVVTPAAMSLLHTNGLGCMVVGHYDATKSRFHAEATPEQQNHAIMLRVQCATWPNYEPDAMHQQVQLYAGHKDGTVPAGVASAKRWTFWKQAMLELERVVAAHPEGIRTDRVQAELPAEFRERLRPRTIQQGIRERWEPFKASNVCMRKAKADGRMRNILYIMEF